MSAVGASALALATTLFLVAPITSAVTPPSASPSPTASPFPYPTVPPASDVPHGPRLVPGGTPDATVTRHGVRLELWRSSPTVAPGE